VAWGEYHRVRAQPVEDLDDEPGALVGLVWQTRIVTPSGRRKAAVDRYKYPVQETDLRPGDELRLSDDTKVGTVEAIDKDARVVDIRKVISQNDVHPDVVVALRIVSAAALEKSLVRIATAIADAGFADEPANRAVHDLLLARPPRLRSGPLAALDAEDVSECARRAVRDLDGSVLAVQGPPGSGKTYLGARMICDLVLAGGRVGVAANSHKVIRKLVADARSAGAETGFELAAAHKVGDDDTFDGVNDGVEELATNEEARRWLEGRAGVLGGTGWLWARPEFAGSVDVLFVDEAGQMSLANALAIAPCGSNLVLLGDPQQLEQPQQGSHPDGAGVSALQHMVGDHLTLPADRGIFLPLTWRLAPSICEFTSEVFYEGRLHSRAGLERQRIVGSSRFSGAGLRIVDVPHDHRRNASDEEVAAVESIVEDLLSPGVCWVNERGDAIPMKAVHMLVVAPYNAQVSRLRDRLDPRGVPVGTVDKFQGQEAPVVIYSMATSRVEDAPRGMDFLYNPNRLNVATSRARCLCVVVASPYLFQPDCKSPHQMRLANALCRYRELALKDQKVECKGSQRSDG
jgi:uncharacterized protein